MAALWAAFLYPKATLWRDAMNIFVYGDESGVFDKAHQHWFVFGGLIFFDKDEKDAANRQFLAAERKIAPSYNGGELKASLLKNKHKRSLFNLTSKWRRFAFVVDLGRVNDGICADKKSRQRYMDYVFKVGLKRVLGRLISSKKLDPSLVENIYVRFDEHTTATDGRYELREAIEQEFKYGTINFRYNSKHPPLFPRMRGHVELTFKDSTRDPLIRASDIIANRVWHDVQSGRLDSLKGRVFIAPFP